MAGHALRGDAEETGAGSGHSHRGLHPGADDRSSDEAGRADGAGRDTEDRQGRHIVGDCETRVNGGEVVRGESMGGERENEVSCSRLDFAGGVVSTPQA